MGSRIVLQRNAPRLALIPPPLQPDAPGCTNHGYLSVGVKLVGPWGTAARWGVAAFNEVNALPLAVAVAVGNLALLAVTSSSDTAVVRVAHCVGA